MQAIDITKEKLDKFFEVYGRYEKAEEEASNELSKARMNSKRRIKYKNEFVEESVLWDELRYVGANGEAGKILKEKYPLVFSKAEEQDKIGAECMSFCNVEMGIDFTKVRVSDIIRICMGVVDYKLKEKENEKSNS